MAIRGIIFDMDGTLTAPDLEFAKIKQAAGIGDVDLLDYLRTATGAEYLRIHKLLMCFEAGGVASARKISASASAAPVGALGSAAALGRHGVVPSHRYDGTPDALT